MHRFCLGGSTDDGELDEEGAEGEYSGDESDDGEDDRREAFGCSAAALSVGVGSFSDPTGGIAHFVVSFAVNFFVSLVSTENDRFESSRYRLSTRWDPDGNFAPFDSIKSESYKNPPLNEPYMHRNI